MSNTPCISIEPTCFFHFDLWDFTEGWQERLEQKFFEFAPSGGESSLCPANASCWGYFTKAECEKLKKQLTPYLNLAKKATS